MLQDPGTGYHALLGHMTHDENGDSQPFGGLHQQIGGFPYLADASGGGGNILPVHGLDGINDHHVRLFVFNGPPDQIQVGLTEEQKLPGDRPDPVGPHLDLL